MPRQNALLSSSNVISIIEGFESPAAVSTAPAGHLLGDRRLSCHDGRQAEREHLTLRLLITHDPSSDARFAENADSEAAPPRVFAVGYRTREASTLCAEGHDVRAIFH